MKYYILLMILSLQGQVILPRSTYEDSKEWNNIKEKVQEWKSLKQKFENDKNHLIHKFEKEFDYLIDNDNLHFEQHADLQQAGVLICKLKCYEFIEYYIASSSATMVNIKHLTTFGLAKIAQTKTALAYKQCTIFSQQTYNKETQEKLEKEAFKKVMATKQEIKGSLSYVINGTLEKDLYKEYGILY